MIIRLKQKAFTLVEVVVSFGIVLITSLATVGAIIFTRQSMELDKQRIAALNYCRQSMEAAGSLDDVYAGTKSLVPFNAPGVETLNSEVSVEYYGLTPAGAVDFSDSRKQPPMDEPVFARVNVEWRPRGSRSQRQRVSMSTILTQGIR